ncbi:MAG: heme-degrading monooxygenase HmoA [Flavobacteriales bacterium]|jgi:heme-degrading monooxygenase HmoA
MITRIVKLTISPDKTDEFAEIFKKSKSQIENFEGCIETNAYTDSKDKNIYFTISKWDSEEALNNYRNSELFTGIWASVKKTFCGKPEAWSLN